MDLQISVYSCAFVVPFLQAVNGYFFTYLFNLRKSNKSASLRVLLFLHFYSNEKGN